MPAGEKVIFLFIFFLQFVNNLSIQVQIQAAVGYCGQNMVETKMFRVVSTRTRKVLETRNVF